MTKILIFGNSGAGKSTLAAEIRASQQLGHLDLDTLAWLPTNPPQRMALIESKRKMERFMAKNDSWIIEGCYTDLLELAEPQASEIIYLNLPVEECIANAKNRPWEPHKYDSPEAQDANLSMLIEWISDYPNRADTFSQSAHQRFYEQFSGKKTTYTSNIRLK